MYVLDSNIVSYAIKGNSAVRHRIEQEIAVGSRLIMPYIVYFEILRWLLELRASTRMRLFHQMLDGYFVLKTLNKNVWDEAANIYVEARRIGKPMGDDADILIAAFCIVNNCTLVTNNKRHFQQVDGLILDDWTE